MKCPQCPYYEQKTSYGVELIKCNNKCGKAETMTNEQAIKVLNMVEAHGTLVIQAKEMAIKALEQEPCEDCISRQAVLDGLASIAKAKARSDAQKSLMGRVIFFTEHLPPVNPQPKTGHWIKTKEQDNAEPLILWKCSECLTVQRLKTNYCPNCGCKDG